MSSKATTDTPQTETPVEQVVKQTRVFDVNAPVYRDLGICFTCNHRSGCMFLQSARHPIAYCEEFDSGSSKNALQAKTPESMPKAEINFGEAQEIGICAACESKTSCIYRQPGVAIWDCQDRP